MDMNEFLEKKKELKEAEGKLKKAKEALNGERKRKLREKFKKINIFVKLKPWIVWNSILTMLVIFLFLGAYTNNPNPDVSEESKFGSFLDNIFGFLSKDKKVTEDNSEVLGSIVVENNTTNQSSTVDNTIDISVTVPEEEIELIDFDIWADYNGEKFNALETNSNNLIYYVVIKNKESFNIKCESSDSNVEVNSYDERSIYSKVMIGEAGEDNKIIVNHEFTCYDVDKSIDTGTKKEVKITVTFK